VNPSSAFSEWKMNAPRTSHPNQRNFIIFALAIAISGLLLPIPSFVELYQIPAETACRPMGQAAAFFICGVGTPLLVFPLGLLGWPGRPTLRRYGIAAMILSLIPFPLYFVLFRWIVDFHHLILEP
jgi:hypothetical protein